MENYIIKLASDAWGQGKTSTAIDIYQNLQERDKQVGGFTLRPVYRNDECCGFEAFLFSTGEHIEIARQDRPEWGEVNYTKHRTNKEKGHDFFHVNDDAVNYVIDQAFEDVYNPAIDAIIIDEIGPLIIQSKSKKRRTGKRLVEITQAILDQPKPVNMLVFSERRIQMNEYQQCKTAIEGHPSRIYNRTLKINLNQTNFRFIAPYTLQQIYQQLKW